MNKTINIGVLFLFALCFQRASSQDFKKEKFICFGGQISNSADNIRGIRLGGFVNIEKVLTKKLSFYTHFGYTLPKTYHFETYTLYENRDSDSFVYAQNATLKNQYFTINFGMKRFVIGDVQKNIGVYIAIDAGLGFSIDDFELDPIIPGNENNDFHALESLYEYNIGALLSSSAGLGISKKFNFIEFFSELKFQYYIDPSLPKNPYIPSNSPDPFKNFQINNKRISNVYTFNLGVRYVVQ